jgi:hypothetical protein
MRVVADHPILAIHQPLRTVAMTPSLKRIFLSMILKIFPPARCSRFD